MMSTNLPSAIPGFPAIATPQPLSIATSTSVCERVDIPHPIQSHVPLASLTSFRVGGPAQWYVAPKQVDDLHLSLAWAMSEGLPITFLGAGSNLLVSDRGLPGLVVGTRHLNHTEFDREAGRITVGAGKSLVRLAWQAAQLGWRGLEWAVGIPGTVGGAVVMNAGAHGACMADMLLDARILTPNGEMSIYYPQDLGYQYRTSILQGGDRLVVQATLQLQPGFEPREVLEDTAQILKRRRSTQPYHRPSCGSVFRNPTARPAGWLIEQIGLKGYQIGGAQVAQRHANFILNCDRATATDIFQLIQHVQAQVAKHWSIDLIPEVKILGEFPAM